MLEREGVPGHVVEHSMVVADVAVLLGNHLNAAGESLDVAVLRAGGLLHDVAKHHSFEGKGDHAEMGAVLLEGMGFDRLGEIVRYHVRLPEGNACDIIDEVTVVHYADKRVRHTEIVSLEERFEDIVLRYGIKQEALKRLRRLQVQVEKLEETIFSRLLFGPGEIRKMVMESENISVAGGNSWGMRSRFTAIRHSR